MESKCKKSTVYIIADMWTIKRGKSSYLLCEPFDMTIAKLVVRCRFSEGISTAKKAKEFIFDDQNQSKVIGWIKELEYSASGPKPNELNFDEKVETIVAA